MEDDPKQFIDDMHRPVCTQREMEVAFEYAGFYGITSDFHPGRQGGDSSKLDMVHQSGYWLLSMHKNGPREKVIADTQAILADLQLEPLEELMVDTRFPSNPIMRSVTVVLPPYQVESSEVAEAIVKRLVEDDIDFEYPKHKSEVRILPTSNPKEFDVTLLTGFEPVYVGTVGTKGKLWRPVRVMNNCGRDLRAKLHFVGYSVEEVALAMVEVLRPMWEPAIRRRVLSMAESDSDDPKDFISQHINYVYIVRDADPMDAWVAKAIWPTPKLKTAVTAVFRHRENALNYASNMGGRVFRVLDDSPIVKAWLSTGQRISESKAEEIEKEAAKAEKPASKEQAEAGNYRKGHVNLQGFEIAIENAKGSTRSGVNKNGTPWKVTMPAHYGYIKGTKGKDKDHLDVYIGPKPDGIMAYVVNQRTFEGAFDEHKIMLGYHSKDEAIADYDAAFSGNLGPRLRASVVSTTVDKLKEWIATGDTKKPFDGIVESLLENEEPGFDEIKDFILSTTPGHQFVDGQEFHIGFAVMTSNEHMIQAAANDEGGEVNWDAVNDAIPIIEKNALAIMDEVGIQCRAEGHDGTGDLVGSAWITVSSKGPTHGFNVIKQFIEQDEPFRTSSGTIDKIAAGAALRLYQGVPNEIARLIDVDISFFDINREAMGLEEADGDEDPKDFALETPMGNQPLLDIIHSAYRQVLALPYEEGHTPPVNFYRQKDAIIGKMLADLEQATGRKLLDGGSGLIGSWTPMPWNQDDVSQKWLRDVLAGFFRVSKKVK